MCVCISHYIPHSYSFGHLLVITSAQWDYTFCKWGFLIVLITGKGPQLYPIWVNYNISLT